MEYELEAGVIQRERVIGEVVIGCDDVILAIGQENAFTWIERDIGMKFDKWDQPVVDPVTFPVDAAAGVLRRRCGAGAEEHHLGGGAGPPGRALDPQLLQRRVGQRSAAARACGSSSRKMGMHEWSYKNDYAPLERRLMPHVSLKERFKKLNIEVELGFSAEQAAQEAQRCLNCDIQTVFEAKLCIECDACIDICPVDCLTITPQRRGGRAARAACARRRSSRRSRCSSPRRCRRPRG